LLKNKLIFVEIEMDADEIIESGLEYEEENEWEEEYDETEEQEASSEIKPELKRLYQQHPECNLDYIEQVLPKIPLQFIPPGGEKADSNHRTYPFLTNFEKTKIIGLRANQLSKGSVPFIAVPKHITDVKDIAKLELEQKRLPYIIKRPLPNGQFEYWRLADLLIL
jgi:DNA-directed RNA polymerase subunit K/omega